MRNYCDIRIWTLRRINLRAAPLLWKRPLLFLIGALSGLKGETEKAWELVRETPKPVIGFVTEIDQEGADLRGLMTSLKEFFEITPLLLTVPVRTDGRIEIVDLIRGGAARIERTEPMECTAEQDDQLLANYLEKGKILPLCTGSPIKGWGTAALIDLIGRLLPPPSPPPQEGPLFARIFKTVIDPFSGRLSYLRVFSGALSTDQPFFNLTKNVKEKGGHLFMIQGKKILPVNRLAAGEIGAVAKLKESMTGDILAEGPEVSSSGESPRAPLLFRRPVLAYAVEPKGKGDDEKVTVALSRLVEEDPTLEFHHDPEMKEMILSGQTPLHVEISLEKLKRKFGVEVSLKEPKIPYRETIRRKASAQGRYKKQSGGHGHSADCWIGIEPLPRTAGFQFTDKIVGGAIPRGFIPYVERGVQQAMRSGFLAGYPVVDVGVTLYDGTFHTVDSAGPDFEITGSVAFKKAMEQAGPVLLEPIMKIETRAPNETVGAVMGDLNARRGKILGVETIGHSERIRALVPRAEILRYAPSLSSLTGGRGTYTIEFAQYEEVPAHLANKIIEERRADQKRSA